MQIGKKLIQLRLEKGISQTKLAQELEVSQPAYNKWESDQSAPSSKNLIRILNFYKISIIVLMGLSVDIDDKGMQIKDSQEIRKIINFSTFKN